MNDVFTYFVNLKRDNCMFRKNLEEAFAKSKRYAPYVATGITAVATFGFFSYKAYKAYYDFKVNPDGSIEAKTVPGASSNADGATAKGNVEALSYSSKGPLVSSAKEAKSADGQVLSHSVDPKTPADLVNALRTLAKPSVAGPAEGLLAEDSALPVALRASADGAIAGRDVLAMSGIFVMPSPEKKAIPTHFNSSIPPFAIERFVERDALFQRVDTAFSLSNRDLIISPTVLTACHGLGGVGKTQLALYYYYKSQKAYPLRCWFLAENESQLDQQYRNFCRNFDISFDEKESFFEISDKVKRWLEGHPGWLLIYDNATDCDSITKHLPRTGGDILVTSRQTFGWSQIGGKEVPVDIVSEDEAIELVKRAISSNVEPMLLEEQEEVSLKKLVCELGYLPLALAQAAAYMKSCPSMTITSYLGKYTNTPDVYLDKPLNQHTYPTSVARTWLITMEEIEKKLPAALYVLKACAYLAPDGIPVQLLSQLGLKSNTVEEKEGKNEEINLINQLADEDLICLSGFSMIGYNENTGHISIHRLVQTVIRQDDQGLPVKDRFEKRLKPLSDALLRLEIFWRKNSKSVEYYLKARLLQSHFKLVIEFLDQLQPEALSKKAHLILLANLCNTVGHILSTVVGDAKSAMDYYQRALKAQKLVYEEDSIAIAITFNNIGNAHGLLGNSWKAHRFLKQALKVKEKHYKEDNIEVATTLNDLGVAYRSLGDYKAMCNVLERALTIQKKMYGEGDHIEIAETLNNLGVAYGLLEDHEKESDYLKKALQMMESYYGENHVEIAKVLNNIGNVYGLQEDYKIMYDYLNRALTIQIEHYGGDHIEVAKALSNVGAIYNSLNEHEKARDYLNRALEMMKKYYGEDHVEVAKVLDNLGIVYGSLGDYKAMHNVLERALKIKGKRNYSYRESPVEMAKTLNSIGDLHYSLKDYEKTRDVLERALGMMVEYYGEKDHIDAMVTRKIIHNLGRTYKLLGHNYEKACDMLKNILEIIEHGERHSVGFNVFNNFLSQNEYESFGNDKTARNSYLKMDTYHSYALKSFSRYHIGIRQLRSGSSVITQAPQTLFTSSKRFSPVGAEPTYASRFNITPNSH